MSNFDTTYKKIRGNIWLTDSMNKIKTLYSNIIRTFYCNFQFCWFILYYIQHNEEIWDFFQTRLEYTVISSEIFKIFCHAASVDKRQSRKYFFFFYNEIKRKIYFRWLLVSSINLLFPWLGITLSSSAMNPFLDLKA